jgi:hypothetical protein
MEAKNVQKVAGSVSRITPRTPLRDLEPRGETSLNVRGGSQQLMLACASGKHYGEATLTV